MIGRYIKYVRGFKHAQWFKHVRGPSIMAKHFCECYIFLRQTCNNYGVKILARTALLLLNIYLYFETFANYIKYDPIKYGKTVGRASTYYQTVHASWPCHI